MIKKRLNFPKSTSLFHKPDRLIFHITSRCNYKCGFCLFHAPSIPKELFNFKDLTFGNFVKMINKFIGATKISLSGGEPFLNKDIFKMIEYANLKNMEVDVSSNGSLIKDKKIDKIINSSIHKLNISVNADNSEDYKKVNGVNAFDTVIENIKELVEKKRQKKGKILITISQITRKENYQRIPNLIKIAEELGVDAVHFYNLIPFGIPNYTKEQSLYWEDSEIVKFLQNIKPSNSKLIISLPRLFKKRDYKWEWQCDLPFKTLPIYGNGYISLCCEDYPRKELGKLLHIKHPWNNSQIKAFRSIMLDSSRPLPSRCKRCNQNYHSNFWLKGKGLK